MYWILILTIFELTTTSGLHNVIYAVNAGGPAHTDINGIKYSRDPLMIGIASSYGKRILRIGRAHYKDDILYQTERYHLERFGYEIPANKNGEYVLVLKFCEVYFEAPNMKVFDILLNGHIVVSDLDIFYKAGYGVAHEEYVPYSIKDKKLHMNGKKSDIVDDRIKLEFVKGPYDNPKINAFYVIRGKIGDVPKLSEDDDEFSEDMNEKKRKNIELKLGNWPKKSKPYFGDQPLRLKPLFIAFGIFIPFLYCLYKH